MSYFLCWIIFFNHIEILFLFETYPLLHVLTTKRFILTQVTQLFNTIWFFSSTISTIFIYPLYIYIFQYFLTSSWYYYQIKLYKTLTVKNLVLFSIVHFLIQFFLLPNILNFFLYWEISDEYSLLRVEAEISLYFYILWLATFKFALVTILIMLTKILTLSLYVASINLIYFYLLKFKKLFLFSIVLCLCLLIPPDLLTQILLTFLIYIFVELFFFYICIKYLIKNAYIKPTIKKTT